MANQVNEFGSVRFTQLRKKLLVQVAQFEVTQIFVKLKHPVVVAEVIRYDAYLASPFLSKSDDIAIVHLAEFFKNYKQLLKLALDESEQKLVDLVDNVRFIVVNDGQPLFVVYRERAYLAEKLIYKWHNDPSCQKHISEILRGDPYKLPRGGVRFDKPGRYFRHLDKGNDDRKALLRSE